MSQEKKNSLEINGTPTQISAKRLSFFDIQAAAPLLMEGTLDFTNYWRHAFTKWLDCEPVVNFDSLSPAEGNQLMGLLPAPAQVMDWLVFREAKPASSDTSSMGDQ